MKRAILIPLALVGVFTIVAGCGGERAEKQPNPEQVYDQTAPDSEQPDRYANPNNVKWGEGSKVQGIYVEVTQPTWNADHSILTYDVTVGNMSQWPVHSLMTDIYIDGVRVEDRTTIEENPGYDLAILPGDGTTFTVARDDIPPEADHVTMKVSPGVDAELEEIPMGPWDIYWSGPIKE